VMWGDEYHNFVSDFDAEYFAESRSRNSINIVLEQGIGGYKRALNLHGNEDVDTFLMNLTTKFVFGSSSVETNRYAADMFGKDIRELGSRSTGMQTMGGGGNVGTSETEH